MKKIFKMKKILGMNFVLGLLLIGFICFPAEIEKSGDIREELLEEKNEIKLKNNKEYDFSYTPTHEDSIIFVYDLNIGNNLEVVLPVIVDKGYVVYWGINHFPSFYTSHSGNFPKWTYGKKELFFVEVVGNVEEINTELFYADGRVHPSADQLVACLRFNKNLKSLYDAFFKCKNLVKIPDSIPSKVKNLRWMLYDCESFDQRIDWNFKKVVDFGNLFGGNCGISSENYNKTIESIAYSKRFEASRPLEIQKMNNSIIKYVYNKSNFELLESKGFDFIDGGYQTANISVYISYLATGYKYTPMVTGITYEPDITEIKNNLKYEVKTDNSDDMAIITPYFASPSRKYYTNFIDTKAKRIIDLRNTKWDSEKRDYTGANIEFKLLNLPTIKYIEFTGNIEKNPGEYIAKVSFDNNRYHLINDNIPKSKKWYIREMIDLKDVKLAYIKYYWTNSDIFQKLINVPTRNGMPLVKLENEKGKEPGQYNSTIKLLNPNDMFTFKNIPTLLSWKIVRKFDLSYSVWLGAKQYWDGTAKTTKITDSIGKELNSAIKITYYDNVKTNHGIYYAKANISTINEYYEIENYSHLLMKEWKIIRRFDLVHAKWIGTYHDWDGTAKTVKIVNIDGSQLNSAIKVEYFYNIKTDPGTYTTEAVISTIDNKVYEIANYSHLTGKKTWRIIRTFDFRSVYWNTDKIYWDGNLKTVELINKPEGYQLINIIYTKNTGIKPDVYEAKVSINYDTSKYHVPHDTAFINKVHKWKIVKKLDLSRTTWENDLFYFDNKEKVMKIINLPSEIKTKVSSGHALKQTAPGKYSSTIIFYDYDTRVYELIGDNLKRTINWKIKKKLFLNDAKWTNTSLKWNGKYQEIDIENVPSEIGKNFTTNSSYTKKAMNQGEYKAQVTLNFPDSEIYEIYNNNLPKIVNWKIWKELDLKDVSWSADKFYWDGNAKEIYLKNNKTDIQFEIKIKENVKTVEGEYEAEATMIYNSNIYAIKNDNFSRKKKWIIIKKLNFNLAKWTNDTFEYDGNEKQIVLNGIPNELKSFSSYTNNKSTFEGIFKARINISGYNTKIYEVSGLNLIQEKNWIIKRTINFGKVNWNETLFKYDGNFKEVKLLNLPENLNPSFGINVIYNANKFKDAGRYQATADLDYKVEIYTLEFNYFLRTNDWKIVQDIDLSKVKWSNNDVAWDGNDKTITLVGLDPLIKPIYTGNVQKHPGIYTATITLDYKEEIYNLLGKSFDEEIEWKIIKTLNLEKVKWTAKELIYNGVSQTIKLENLPNDIKVTYTDNRMKNLGIYKAVAIFDIDESCHNLINRNFDNEFEWIIYKKFNLAGVDWNFKKFIWDGNQKELKLVGLPYEITSETEYENNIEKNPGKYKAKVKFSYDSKIYKIENKMFDDEVEWKIVKTIDFSNTKWTEKEQYYDGFNKEMRLLNVEDEIKISYKGNIESEAGKYEAEYELLHDSDIYEIINNNVSKKITWNIFKEISLANVYWNENLFNYNGSEHQVYLVNLPVEIEYKYTNDKQMYAGKYIASVTLKADEYKYKIIDNNVKSLEWKIVKILDLVDTNWNQKEFKYDGNSKKVELVGLPSEIKVTYANNIKSDSGRYTATITSIDYDLDIYGVINDNFDDYLVWFILEEINLRDLKWSNNRFLQDGSEHQVYLEGINNIDSRIKVSYKGEKASNFGKYNAIAEFIYDRDKIKTINEPDLNLTWFIAKKLDFKDVTWCHNKFEYDGGEKRVFLKNLPDEEIKVVYKGHKGVAPGKYKTVVEIIYDNDIYIGNDDFGIFEWDIIDVKVLKGSNLWAYIMTGLSSTILIEFLVIARIKKNKMEEGLEN